MHDPGSPTGPAPSGKFYDLLRQGFQRLAAPLGDAGGGAGGALQPGGRRHRRAGGRGVPARLAADVRPGARRAAPLPHAADARGGAAARSRIPGPGGWSSLVPDGGRADLGHPGLHLGARGRGARDRRHDPVVSPGGGHDPGAGAVDQVGRLDHHDRHGGIGGPGGADRPDRLGLRVVPGPGAAAAARRAADPDAGRRGGRRRGDLPGAAGRGPVRRRGPLLVDGLRVGRPAALPGQLDHRLLDVRPVHHAPGRSSACPR